MTVTDFFWEYIEKNVDSSRIKSAILTGLWVTDLVFQPISEEISFELSYVIATIEQQGCAFLPHGHPGLSSFANCVGAPLCSLRGKAPKVVQLAALDALGPFSTGYQQYAERHIAQGTPAKKSLWRADIVAQEVRRLFPRKTQKAIGLVGYSGAIERALCDHEFDVAAFDLHPRLQGYVSSLGTPIRRAEDLPSCLQALDGIVVTGMTISNQTFAELMSAIRIRRMPVVLYCQTGANICHSLLSAGVNAVVSECFPFYNFCGISEIRLYRRSDGDLPISI